MSWDWVDETEKAQQEDRSKEYFNVKNGSQQFVLLSHFAKLAQVWEPGTRKYRMAEEGDTNVSIKGVCWVLEGGVIKQAKLPYPVVKAIKAIAEDPEWEFELPFPRMLTLRTTNAGTKDAEYSISPSPKLYEIPMDVLEELGKKPHPDAIIEKMKTNTSKSDAPREEAPDVNPEDMPW